MNVLKVWFNLATQLKTVICCDWVAGGNRPHVEFSIEFGVCYQESHLYKQHWYFTAVFLKNNNKRANNKDLTLWTLSVWYHFMKSNSTFDLSSIQKPHQTDSTITFRHHLWSHHIYYCFAEVTFTAGETVCSSFTFLSFFLSQIRPRLAFHLVWTGRAGAGLWAARVPEGAELLLRYSLLHWDSHWIQSHCQAWIGGLSP